MCVNDAQRVKNTDHSDCQQDANLIAARMGTRSSEEHICQRKSEQLIVHTEAETVTDGREEREGERWTKFEPGR